MTRFRTSFAVVAVVAQVALIAGCPASASAETKGPAKGVFSSRYTELRGTGCRADGPERKKGEEGEGGDVPQVCRGFGGYVVRLNFSATETSIEVARGKAFSRSLTKEDDGFLGHGAKMEWRLKDGMPFAVIVRRYDYDLNKEPRHPDPRNKTGERLLIRGLQGFDKLSAEVNVREKNANERARRIADDFARARR